MSRRGIEGDLWMLREPLGELVKHRATYGKLQLLVVSFAFERANLLRGDLYVTCGRRGDCPLVIGY